MSSTVHHSCSKQGVPRQDLSVFHYSVIPRVISLVRLATNQAEDIAGQAGNPQFLSNLLLQGNFCHFH